MIGHICKCRPYLSKLIDIVHISLVLLAIADHAAMADRELLFLILPSAAYISVGKVGLRMRK